MMYFFPSPSARMTMSDISDQIRKLFFGVAKTRESQPQKEDDDHETQDEARPIERTLAAQNAPPESVDDADHRVQAVQQTPLLRHNAAAEADRRNVQAD